MITDKIISVDSEVIEYDDYKNYQIDVYDALLEEITGIDNVQKLLNVFGYFTVYVNVYDNGKVEFVAISENYEQEYKKEVTTGKEELLAYLERNTDLG